MENMVVDQNFWRDKSVLITGHTGFKGSWLSLWLQSLGAKISGIALPPPTQPNLFSLARVADGLENNFLENILELDKLHLAFQKARPDIVIHMAAQSLVRPSYVHPVETYATNVMGTVHVLEAVRQSTCTRVMLTVTSDKCYDNKEWIWGYRETDPMGGYDPYSSSKGCAELVTAAYRNSYFRTANESESVGLASVRAGNVIGGGDWGQDRLVPDIMRALLSGETIVIRNPEAIRPWQHVLEPLAGYMHLAQRLWESPTDFSEGWNFGPNESDARPVSWIADRLTSQWGQGSAWRIADDAQSQPHEAHYLRLDCAKAKSRLGWQPRWDLHACLTRIIDWYQAYQKQEDMRVVCMRQIEDYKNK